MTIDDVVEDVIDQGLEYCGSIRQPEQHYEVLVVSPGRVERGLPLISFLYPDQVVRVPEVQLREEARLLQRGEGGVDEWDWVAVLHRDAVETAVVVAGPECPILLPDKEEAGAFRGWRGTNEPSS